MVSLISVILFMCWWRVLGWRWVMYCICYLKRYCRWAYGLRVLLDFRCFSFISVRFLRFVIYRWKLLFRGRRKYCGRNRWRVWMRWGCRLSLCGCSAGWLLFLFCWFRLVAVSYRRFLISWRWWRTCLWRFFICFSRWFFRFLKYVRISIDRLWFLKRICR